MAVRPFCAGYLVSGDQRQNISLFLNDNNFNVWTNKVAQISPRMLEISSQWFSNFKVLQGAWPGTRVAIRHASYASIIQFSRLLNSYHTFITFSNDNPEIFLHQGFLNDQMHVFLFLFFFKFVLSTVSTSRIRPIVPWTWWGWPRRNRKATWTSWFRFFIIIIIIPKTSTQIHILYFFPQIEVVIDGLVKKLGPNNYQYPLPIKEYFSLLDTFRHF